MDYQRLRFKIEGRLATITLRASRLDLRLLRELDDAASVIADDREVAATLIAAEGADFCLGWDDAARDELTSPAQAIVDPFAALGGLTCPTVAAIRGRAVSGGLELALSCDIRMAEAGARFAFPDVSQGFTPLGGASQRLPRIAGKATALSMLLLGDELDAAAAYACGLVSRVAARGTLESETASVIDAITSRGPLALRYAKEAALRGSEMSLEQGLRLETDLSVILQSTEDRAEGLRAFFEKRPPQFEGR